MEIYKDNELIDINNISIKDFREETNNLKERILDIDFSSISKLKGDKNILNISFLNQIAEELNLE